MIPAPRETGLDEPHDYPRVEAIRHLKHEVQVVRHQDPCVQLEVKLLSGLDQGMDQRARRVSISEERTAVGHVGGDQ
jgi:hypothetical protein